MAFNKFKKLGRNLSLFILLINGKIKNRFSREPDAKYLGLEETVTYILDHRVSIGRIGDGEMLIISGRSQYFQKRDSKLRKKLSKLKTTERFLLCLPILSLTDKEDSLFEEREIAFWGDNRRYFLYRYRKLANKSGIVGEAFISRFYMPYRDKRKEEYVKLLKQIWNCQIVVFIEGYYSRLGVGNDLFANVASIKRILCPPDNAFQKYDEIVDVIRKNVSKEALLILALGPTATALAYDLTVLGYWALDLGHIDIEYEWYKRGATQKASIPGKYCGETETDYPDFNTNDIYDQIIAIIR